jgi:hypothetical protein
VRKVNIDTDIRLAMTGAMRRAMARDPAEHPRKPLKEVLAPDLQAALQVGAGQAGRSPMRSARGRRYAAAGWTRCYDRQLEEGRMTCKR